MNYFLISMSALFLVACQTDHSEDGGEIKEFITDAAPNQDSLTGSAISPSLSDSLDDYFSAPVLNQIDQYLTDFNSLTTPEQFEQNYASGMALFDSIYADLNDPSTDYLLTKSAAYEYWSAIEIFGELLPFNGSLGPIHFDCVAECTEIESIFNLTLLEAKAQQTQGKADDDFMKLVISMEGNYGYAAYPGFKSWETQTWDLGGNSDIGNNILYACIERCQKFQKTYPNYFVAQVNAIHESFVDALIYVSIFSHNQEKILKEYDRILELEFFTPEETLKIKEHYLQIQTGGDDFQFDCETNDCNYG